MPAKKRQASSGNTGDGEVSSGNPSFYIPKPCILRKKAASTPLAKQPVHAAVEHSFEEHSATSDLPSREESLSDIPPTAQQSLPASVNATIESLPASDIPARGCMQEKAPSEFAPEQQSRSAVAENFRPLRIPTRGNVQKEAQSKSAQDPASLAAVFPSPIENNKWRLTLDDAMQAPKVRSARVVEDPHTALSSALDILEDFPFAKVSIRLH